MGQSVRPISPVVRTGGQLSRGLGQNNAARGIGDGVHRARASGIVTPIWVLRRLDVGAICLCVIIVWRVVAILAETTGDINFIFTPRAAGAGGWHAPALVAALRRAGRASVLKRAKLATKTSRLQRLKSSFLATGEVGYRHCPQRAPPVRAVAFFIAAPVRSAPTFSDMSSRTAANLRASRCAMRATVLETTGSGALPSTTAMSATSSVRAEACWALALSSRLLASYLCVRCRHSARWRSSHSSFSAASTTAFAATSPAAASSANFRARCS
mmetsp:Transcript_21241/g.52837  ORF Transcript_21241/g.52837 Transcript_21241/m.52837 type:complete len:271 (-) Transcript_21241:332-1144(-)